MISLDFDMILTSVIMSVLLGIISAPIYLVFKALIYCFASLNRNNSKKGSLFIAVVANTIDFTFITVMGIAQILINYVACDGAFSGYSLIAMVISFYLTCNLTGKPFDMLYRKIKEKLISRKCSK